MINIVAGLGLLSFISMFCDFLLLNYVIERHVVSKVLLLNYLITCVVSKVLLEKE